MANGGESNKIWTIHISKYTAAKEESSVATIRAKNTDIAIRYTGPMRQGWSASSVCAIWITARVQQYLLVCWSNNTASAYGVGVFDDEHERPETQTYSGREWARRANANRTGAEDAFYLNKWKSMHSSNEGPSNCTNRENRLWRLINHRHRHCPSIISGKQREAEEQLHPYKERKRFVAFNLVTSCCSAWGEEWI